MNEQAWWEGGWSGLPTERTRSLQPQSRRFNLQLLVEPAKLSEALQASGWEPAPDSDWRWIIQALNPDPDEATLPLLGRAYLGRTEDLLLRRSSVTGAPLQTLRLWDSGVRLQPGERVLYLAQYSEEELVQRFRAFSYWRALPFTVEQMGELRQALGQMEQLPVSEQILLLR
jgi:hypothetical protein